MFPLFSQWLNVVVSFRLISCLWDVNVNFLSLKSTTFWRIKSWWPDLRCSEVFFVSQNGEGTSVPHD